MDKALKQRLVGASVLIALAVIVLPMLLGGRPESGTEGPEKIELPQQPPELSFETRRYPIGETEGNGQNKSPDNVHSVQVTNLPAPRNLTTEITPLGATPDSAVPDSDAEQSDAAVKLPPAEQLGEHLSGTDDPGVSGPESQDQGGVPDSSVEQLRTGTDSERYIVQVASFGAVENAKRLSGTLSKSGYSVTTDSVKSDVGTLHRVRVGPFDSEAEANQAVVALESSIAGVKPRVMDLQPERTAQVSTPDDPLVRWVVQVGSFSSSANAENLVAALRLEGHSAYQETISTSGSEIYRVRIGPFLLRDEAIRTEHQVREKMSLKGVVMSAD